MKISNIAVVAVTLLCSVGASPALAINLMKMEDMPIRYMTDEDKDIFKSAVVKVLEQGKDGVTSSWENGKTGARGDLTPRASFEFDGRPCRELEVANSARGRSNRLVLDVCRQDDGDWKVDPR